MGKVFVALFSLLFIVLTMSSCTNAEKQNAFVEVSETETEDEIEIVPPTAIENLDEEGKYIFDALVIVANGLQSPSSLRLLELSTNQERLGEEFYGHFIVKIQGDNAFGSPVSNYYLLITEMSEDYNKNNIMIEYDGAIFLVEMNEDIDYIGNINKALKEHWENMGLN